MRLSASGAPFTVNPKYTSAVQVVSSPAGVEGSSLQPRAARIQRHNAVNSTRIEDIAAHFRAALFGTSLRPGFAVPVRKIIGHASPVNKGGDQRGSFWTS